MSATSKDSRKRRSDGDGSIYQEHVKGCSRPVDGRGRSKCKCKWVGAIVLGYRDDKPVRRKVSAPTQSGATTKLRELRDKYADQQLPAAGTQVTVAKWMTHWLAQIAPRRTRPLTLASYKTKVEHYIIPLLGHHKIDELTPEHIEAAWDELLEKGSPRAEKPKPLAPATVRQTHRILSRALKVAVQRRRLKHNPADGNSMDAPTVVEKEMGVLTVDQVKQVLETAKGDRLEARWAIALALGLRQGEALGLRWEDIDLKEGTLRVRQALQRIPGKGIVFGEPKSKRSKRDLALHPEMVAILKRHRKNQRKERLAAGTAWIKSDLVFTRRDGGPLDPSPDSKAWRALLKRAGVPPVRLHDARHSAATIMLMQGVSTRIVMDTLGHSQISVTTKYQHVVDQMQHDAAKATGDAIWG